MYVPIPFFVKIIKTIKYSTVLQFVEEKNIPPSYSFLHAIILKAPSSKGDHRMDIRKIKRILKDTAFPHVSGTPEELKVAEYLKKECEALGVEARIEELEKLLKDNYKLNRTI